MNPGKLDRIKQLLFLTQNSPITPGDALGGNDFLPEFSISPKLVCSLTL